jgi:microcystin-dependent protein
VTISGNLLVDGIRLNQEIKFMKVIDNSAATTDTMVTIIAKTPWIVHNPLYFGEGSILFHNIKVSGYVSKTENFDWPEYGHDFVFSRSTKEDAAESDEWYWDSSNNISDKRFKHTFNTQGEHEESTYSMTETVPYDVSYNSWRCDISGGGGLNDVDDKLTWTITRLTAIPYFTPIEQNSLINYDISSNGVSSFTDVSIQHLNIVGLMEGDISSNDISVNHLNVNVIDKRSNNNVSFLSDVSFGENVNITGDLTIDGSFSFNEVIQNITTVNNELLVSTQVDISNHGTGPALSVTQYGDGTGDNIVLFHTGETDGSAVEVKHDGKAIFYEDVSFEKRIVAPDASFNRIDAVDGSLIVNSDISVNGELFLSGGNLGGVPIGCILMWSGSVANIPIYWRLCDGNNNTPNLMNRFIVGGGGDYDVDNSGGAVDKTLTESNLPSHNHHVNAQSVTAAADGNHRHYWQASRQLAGRDDDNNTAELSKGDRAAGDTMTKYTNYAGNHSHTVAIPSHNTNDTGSGASFNILPPYYALCYIIYVG